ncbi:TetR/AcrR family transcriptional regulator [Pseudonocardia ailaonensis]|uniref:TetR/AcrR family transcriptional regulator n=1 Tax=Pseudonocardia ailaonensis TaxID=367279 RepID=A0ABN2N0B5_9PSEU
MTRTTDRRSSILSGAAELFARQGVASSTVRQIADRVGMLSGSLYHHFPSKDAMVVEILTGYLDNLLARYRSVLGEGLSPRARLERLVHASLTEAELFPHATLVYQNELTYLRSGETVRSHPGFEGVRAAAAEVQQTWMDVIEAGRADGSFRTDIDARVFYRFLRDSVWLAVHWHRPDGGPGIDRLAGDCVSLFLDGFATFDEA